MRIARVFPRKTTASPDDLLAFFGPPPRSYPEVDVVHVSVAFSFDTSKAERLAEKWMRPGVSVEIGGPGYGSKGGDFVPGMYLKQGYVITSRGCPNKCEFCRVPQLDGPLTELSIADDLQCWPASHERHCLRAASRPLCLNHGMPICSERVGRSAFTLLTTCRTSTMRWLRLGRCSGRLG